MVGVGMMMLWWQYDDHFLKTSNFEEALGPGEDVVEVANVLPLQHLEGVFFLIGHLSLLVTFFYWSLVYIGHFFIGHLFLLINFLLVTCFLLVTWEEYTSASNTSPERVSR